MVAFVRFVLIASLLAVAMTGCGRSGGHSRSYQGMYVAGTIALELRYGGDKHRGELWVDGQRFTVEGDIAADGSLTGFFSRDHDAVRFPFTFTDRGGAPTLTSQGNTIRMERTWSQEEFQTAKSGVAPEPSAGSPPPPRPPQPLPTPKPAASTPTPVPSPQPVESVQPPPPQPAPKPAPAETSSGARPQLPQKFSHPAGFTVGYPAGWNVQQDDEGRIYLAPPNVPRDPQGQPLLSVMLIVSAPTNVRTIADASGELIERSILEMLAQAQLRLSPISAPEAIPGRGDAAVARFAGRTADGKSYRVGFYRVLSKGLLLQLFAAGLEEHAARHDGELRTVLASVTHAEPARDPQLIGDWKNVQTYHSGTFTSVTQLRRVYNADGSYRSDSRAMAGDSDNTIDTGTDPGSVGRWFAANGEALIVTASGEQIRFSYTMHNGQIAERLGAGKYRFWER